MNIAKIIVLVALSPIILIGGIAFGLIYGVIQAVNCLTSSFRNPALKLELSTLPNTPK
jgi:Trk-type K+ transport system membrane component